MDAVESAKRMEEKTETMISVLSLLQGEGRESWSITPECVECCSERMEERRKEEKVKVVEGGVASDCEEAGLITVRIGRCG